MQQESTTKSEHVAEASRAGTNAASAAFSTKEVLNSQGSASHQDAEPAAEDWRAQTEGTIKEEPQGNPEDLGRIQGDATVLSNQGTEGLQPKAITRTERSSKRTKGSKGKAKVVDISEPPVYGSAPLIAEKRFQRKAASEPGSLEEGAEAVEGGPGSVRAFWERESKMQGLLPRPRTPQKSAPGGRGTAAEDDRAARAKASAAEAAICDRFGNPVLSLGVSSGVTRALAAIEDFSQAIPAFARFREAAARAQQAVSGRGDGNATMGSRELAQDGDAPTIANETADPGTAAAAQNESATTAAREEEEGVPTVESAPQAQPARTDHSTSLHMGTRDAVEPAQALQPEAQLADGRQNGNRSKTVTQLEGKESRKEAEAEGLAKVKEGSAARMQQDTYSAVGLGEAEPSQPAEYVHTEETQHPTTAGSGPFSVEHGPIETSQEGGTVESEQEEGGSAKAAAQSSETAADVSGDDSFESRSIGDERNPPGSSEQEAVKLREGQLRDEEATPDLSEEAGTVASRILEEATDVGLPALEACGKSEALGEESSHGAPKVGELPSAGTSVAPTADDDMESTMLTSRTVSVTDSEPTGSEHGSRQDLTVAAAFAAGVSPKLSALQRSKTGETSSRGSDADSEWRAQTKHIFVLSNAGKPIFTLHGEGNQLAGLMAAIHAMISFAADRGDGLRSLRAGRHLVVFLVRGPLHLVAASSRGEGEGVLRNQLALLHSQILCILTAGFERMFTRNPRFDVRRLLGGTDGILRGLISGFERTMWALMKAFPPMPLPADLRHTCLTALQAAVKGSGALFGLLLAGDLVCAVGQSRAHPFDQSDLLLLCNFVASSESFLQSPESFTPVCLPAFNPAAFLHAYVRCLHVGARICLVLLSSHQDSFHTLSAAAKKFSQQCREPIKRVAAAALKQEGGGLLQVPDLPTAVGGGAPGHTPLLHFVFKSPARGQLVAPHWTCPLDDSAFCQEVAVAYARTHSAMFPEASASGSVQQSSRRIHFEQSNSVTVLAFHGPDYELYAAFDAVVAKAEALEICQKLSSWVKKEQATLFIPV